MAEQLYRHCIHLLYIVASVAVTLFSAACSSPQYRRELLAADSLSMSSPQKAITLLDSMSSEMKSAPKHEQMYYELLRIKAADKAYINHQSDSTVLNLVDYYENGGDAHLLPEAYYYAGCVYRDLNDAPRAIEYYQKADDELKGSKNYRLLSNINAQKGFLFKGQYLYEEARQAHFKAYRYDCLLKDTVNIIYSLRDIAGTYKYKNNTDSSLTYLNKALILATKIKDTRLMNDIKTSIANIYIQKKDYDTALNLLRPSLADSASIEKSFFYNITVGIYMQTKQYDSAYIYSMRLLDIGTIYAKQTASESLANIYIMRGDYANAAKYIQLTRLHIDSIFKITATESVARMNSLYNYNLREKENLELKAENASQLNVILIFTLVFIIALLGAGAYIIRLRQKRKKIIEKFKQMRKELFEQSEAYIKENEAKIAELETLLESTNYENKVLTAKIEQQKAELIFANETAKRKQKINEAAKDRLINTDIYKTIIQRAKAGKVLHVDEWDTLDQTINAEIENFKQRLKGFHDISTREYRLCMLIRLDISVKDMAALLCLTASGISKARKRLQEKIFENEGTLKDFDTFIKSL